MHKQSLVTENVRTLALGRLLVALNAVNFGGA
jgi:hypothetical protein